MPKCARIKNPCKICLGQVSEKNGLQCKGACKSWVHFNCLNYTPGKIKDIKAGIIKVTCPCPDCKTTMPKEYRTDAPFSCNNMKCPANMPPKCGNTGCPSSKGQPNDGYSQAATGCALDKCGKCCKPNSFSHTTDFPPPIIAPCDPFNQPPFPFPATASKCMGLDACETGCTSSKDVPGDLGTQRPSMGALEQMCNTVGQLTNQINSLMTEMKQAVTHGRSNQNRCSEKDPKSMCPKPCFCPENPGR